MLYANLCALNQVDSLVRVAPKYKLETRLHPDRPGLNNEHELNMRRSLIAKYTSGQGQAIKAVFENTPRLD